MTCGVYSIKNKISGKHYVGQSIDIECRWRMHRNELNGNRHHNSHLQNAWNLHGESAFEFLVLQQCEADKAALAWAEQQWLDTLRSADRRFGYNIAAVAASNLGVTRSPEARAKMSAAKKRISAETKEKLRLAVLGKKQSPELIAKRAAACRNPSPEVRARMSKASKGRIPSLRTRQLLRDAKPTGQTGERGIHKNGPGFCVRFQHKRQRIYAGQFPTIEQAISARNAAFAELNINP